MRFMHSHGYPTHHLADKKGVGANPYSYVPNDAVPVLTRDDSSKFIEMEYKSALIGDQMRIIFHAIKKAVDKMGCP